MNWDNSGYPDENRQNRVALDFDSGPEAVAPYATAPVGLSWDTEPKRDSCEH
jgi:hypothetical protein